MQDSKFALQGVVLQPVIDQAAVGAITSEQAKGGHPGKAEDNLQAPAAQSASPAVKHRFLIAGGGDDRINQGR